MPYRSLFTGHVGSCHAVCRVNAICSSDRNGRYNGAVAGADRIEHRDVLHSSEQIRYITGNWVTSRMEQFAYEKVHPVARLRPLAALNAAEFRKLQAAKQKDEEDDDLCPVECVKEFRTNAELASILEAAKETNSLVVVDFYRTACGSCKYIEQGFIKLCKGAGDDEAAVIFLKHNVMDEYDEQSEVAEQLKIKVVPLFHFYKDGQLVEAFPTRERAKILETLHKYVPSSLKISETGT